MRHWKQAPPADDRMSEDKDKDKDQNNHEDNKKYEDKDKDEHKENKSISSPHHVVSDLKCAEPFVQLENMESDATLRAVSHTLQGDRLSTFLMRVGEIVQCRPVRD